MLLEGIRELMSMRQMQRASLALEHYHKGTRAVFVEFMKHSKESLCLCLRPKSTGFG